MQKEVFCRGLFFRLLTQVLNIAALRNIRMSIFPLEIDFKHAITQWCGNSPNFLQFINYQTFSKLFLQFHYIYIYNIYNTYSHPILQGFPKKKPLVTKRHPHFGEKSSRSPTMRTSKWAKLRRLRRCEVWGGLPGCNPVATYRSCWVVLKQKYVKNQYECWKTRGGKPVVITCSRFVITGSYGWVWLVCLEGFGNVSSNIYIYWNKYMLLFSFTYWIYSITIYACDPWFIHIYTTLLDVRWKMWNHL